MTPKLSGWLQQYLLSQVSVCQEPGRGSPAGPPPRASGLGSLKVKVSGGTAILSRLGWEGPVPRLTWNVAVGRMSSA